MLRARLGGCRALASRRCSPLLLIGKPARRPGDNQSPVLGKECASPVTFGSWTRLVARSAAIEAKGGGRVTASLPSLIVVVLSMRVRSHRRSRARWRTGWP